MKKRLAQIAEAARSARGFLVAPLSGSWSLAVSFLFVVTVVSALAVIYTAYEYRRLFNQHQKLVQQRDDLQVEWGQLLLEQSALAALSEVEKTVRAKLDMYVPAPEEVVVVRP